MISTRIAFRSWNFSFFELLSHSEAYLKDRNRNRRSSTLSLPSFTSLSWKSLFLFWVAASVLSLLRVFLPSGRSASFSCSSLGIIDEWYYSRRVIDIVEGVCTRGEHRAVFYFCITADKHVLHPKPWPESLVIRSAPSLLVRLPRHSRLSKRIV